MASDAASAFNDHWMNDRLKPLVEAWTSKLKHAREKKREFQEVADQCEIFYNNAQAFWTDQAVRSKFMGDNSIAPKFKLSMCKAFELVAIMGPMLFWQNPQRQVEPKMLTEPVQGMFPDPQSFQMAQQSFAQTKAIRAVRAALQKKVLNYLPGAQFGGGLTSHSRRAVTEMLVKGRGCVWTELYPLPGTEGNLVGSHYDSVDNLLIDPDCKNPDLSDAYWVARKVTEPVWKVERRYGLPAGTLKGTSESSESLAETSPKKRGSDRKSGKTNNLITYYHVWSKTGCGYRFQQQTGEKAWNDELFEQLEGVTGDYVYLCVVPGLAYPLNLPGATLGGDANGTGGMAPEQIAAALKWPSETWRTGGWPCAFLDAYEDTSGPWPIAPLKPAIGELVFLNVIMSAVTEAVWNSSRNILAVNANMYDEVLKAMALPSNPIVLKMSENIANKVQDVVNFVQQGQVNPDVWQIIDRVIELFERRTGLTDFLAGQQRAQDRSAEATSQRKDSNNIRPDDMGTQVEKWQTLIAVNERLACYEYLTGQDVALVLDDQTAGQLWDALIKTQPVDTILRSADVTIEAGSTRKPNKAKQVQNLQDIAQYLFPVLQGYAQVSGDTQPLQAFLGHMYDAFEMDGSDFRFGQMLPPPPPPEVAQQQQAQQQAEQQGQQAEVAAKQAEMQAKQQLMQMEMSMKQQELQLKAQEAQMKLQMQAQQLQMEQAKMQLEGQGLQMKAKAKEQQLLLQLQGDQAAAQAAAVLPEEGGAV